MFDISTGLSLLTSLLPIGRAYSFARYAPALWKAAALVAHIDANNDGKISGAEKRELAKKEFILACATIPELQALCGDPALVESILNDVVSALNKLTNHSAASGTLIPTTLAAVTALADAAGAIESPPASPTPASAPPTPLSLTSAPEGASAPPAGSVEALLAQSPVHTTSPPYEPPVPMPGFDAPE